MNKLSILSFAVSLALLSGCASELAVRDLSADPDLVAVGEVSVLAVVFSGPTGRVASVSAVVREAPDMVFALFNDGTHGDTSSGDNTWTTTIPVPLEATPGSYNLDLLALDVEGNPIAAEGIELNGDGYIGTVVVTVM